MAVAIDVGAPCAGRAGRLPAFFNFRADARQLAYAFALPTSTASASSSDRTC